MASYNKTSWWPLKIERFDTSNHPAITTKDKKSEEVQLRLTHNELQILEGLAKILECKKGDAVRIALHIRHDKAQATPERSLGGREGGRTNRFKVRLTSYEYDLLSAIEGSLSDNLRHIIWDLSSLIKAGKLNRIPGCRRRTEKEKNKNWIEANKGREKGSTLTHLIDAKEAAKDAAWDAADERYEAVGQHADALRADLGSSFGVIYRDEEGKVDMHQVMEDMQMDSNAREDADLAVINRITDREKGIKALAIQYSIWTGDSVDECMEQAEDDWDEVHAELDDDDLEDELTQALLNTMDQRPLGDSEISVYKAEE